MATSSKPSRGDERRIECPDPAGMDQVRAIALDVRAESEVHVKGSRLITSPVTDWLLRIA
jgi:hypothetical protein